MSIEIIEVDYLNAKHADELVFLLNEYAKDPMGGNEPLSEIVQTNLASTMARQGNVFSVISYVNGKAAGLINCVTGFSTFACKPLVNIHDVVVLEQYRGLGLSTKMLEFVEQKALSMGCCKLTLEVLTGNKVAQNAYIKVGFAGYELDPEQGKAEFWQKKLS